MAGIEKKLAGKVALITSTDYDRLFSINVKGTYFSYQLVAQHVSPNGRIINFSTSVARKRSRRAYCVKY
ncbi:hypothetical protein ABE288_07810 [Bacillus salipaludis]|uniref:hypothetical protein n=1 Tax=Bacillus salipaludis TaxID=2547811 RepID=UPI003D208DFE